MLTNATILRIDTPGTPAGNGVVPLVTGAAISTRCSWQDPKSGRKWILGATVSDATAVLYVEGNVAVVPGSVATLRVDGEVADRQYLVVAVSPQVGLSMTNTEVYLKNL